MLSRPSCGWRGMKGVFSQEPQPSTPTLIASPRALSEQCLLLKSCSALLRALNTESAQYIHIGLPWWLPSKESVCNAGDSGSIPRLGGSTGEGKGNPLQYSCLGSPMDRGAWWATVHGVAWVGHDLATAQQLTLNEPHVAHWLEYSFTAVLHGPQSWCLFPFTRPYQIFSKHYHLSSSLFCLNQKVHRLRFSSATPGPDQFPRSQFPKTALFQTSLPAQLPTKWPWSLLILLAPSSSGSLPLLSVVKLRGALAVTQTKQYSRGGDFLPEKNLSNWGGDLRFF